MFTLTAAVVIATASSDLEQTLLDTPDPAQLRTWHDILCDEPHIAGTPGDKRTIDFIASAFRDMGLDVQVHPISVYLSQPVSASLTIVEPDRVDLPLIEQPFTVDPRTGDPRLTFGFNAYAKTGDVVGEIVYANYGRLEDYVDLLDLGVDLRGKIVLARYGGNHRGYKVRYAEEAGAAGIIIYTDPADAGRGPGYPEGGWANEWSIQRGSIASKPYPGDPLTPFVEATRTARRLDPSKVDLPNIPSQPIGWYAAREIFARMGGSELPPELREKWTGGLDLPYRLEGGPGLRVRIQIKQDRKIVETANVIGTLRGTTNAEETVVLGCHHDAWGYGAGDPDAGMICLIECARSYSVAARRGQRPERTIQFAAWGAEEYGIIGSTEWVEGNVKPLGRHGIAYINLDMAAMGPKFGGSASPSLQELIRDVTKVVPQAGGASGETVYDRWTADGAEPRLGNLGGGSDHIAFLCHVGIPSCGLGARGSSGVSYHSNYDTLHWYRQVVGDDYLPAKMVTQVAGLLAARLATDPVLPYDPVATIDGVIENLDRIQRLANEDYEEPVEFSGLRRAAGETRKTLKAAMDALAGAGPLSFADAAQVNAALIAIERSWIDDRGLPGRPWFRNLYAANDPTSGYAAWILPGIRLGVELGDPRILASQRTALHNVLGEIAAHAERIRRVAGG